MAASVIITKASGEKVPFSQNKLERSLKRAGASKPVINTVIEKIKAKLFAGITTKEIYHIAFEILKHNESPTAAKYKLKRAIMELGPSGFPFEKFVAEILKSQGYTTRIGVIETGQCISHEIDIIAKKNGRQYMVECKYHNQKGFMNDVKMPLYIQSRFKDVEKTSSNSTDGNIRFHQAWIITNTRFTTDAIKYSQCIGLQLTGWDYPANNGLREQIDQLKLYPVTCLTSLTQLEKSKLLELGLILVKDLCTSSSVLSKIGISVNRIKKILAESNEICAEGLS